MEQLLITGRGSLTRITELTEALGIRAPLLVCDRHTATVFPAPHAALFSDFHPNPDFADCLAGAALYRGKGCDGLISMGGGSSMDTAKAIKTLLSSPTPEDAMASRLSADIRVPHIAIPTTAGTGSEATAVAVMYVDGQKLSLNHAMLVPDGVVLDSSLLDTLPLYHKKSCALDALCQGIESFWAARATAESRMHAQRAFLGVLKHITAYLAGDRDAADALQQAAWESGRAIRMTATTAAHAMSYQITKKLGLAHGHACALTLPVLWSRLLALPETRPVTEALAAAIGLSPEDAPRLVTGLLLAIGMRPEQQPDDALLDYLAATVNVERLSNHPEALTKDVLRSIYAQAFAGPGTEEAAACLALWRQYDE